MISKDEVFYIFVSYYIILNSENNFMVLLLFNKNGRRLL